PSAPAEYGDRISGQHRLVSLPADPVQHRRRIAFKFPVRNRAVLVLNIQEEIEVWVRPLDAGYHARQCNGLGAVVLRPKRMMTEGGYRSKQQTPKRQPGVFSLFHRFFSFPRPAPTGGD